MPIAEVCENIGELFRSNTSCPDQLVIELELTMKNNPGIKEVLDAKSWRNGLFI
jgi:hypothetical protein